VDLQERVRYNANMSRSWFGAIVALIDQITILSLLLTGSALIRERERGTVEHLLVMPVTPLEIMSSKDLVDGNRRADKLRDFDGLGRRGCAGRSY
jgi:ABC-2 type transport system permease protein